MLLAVPQDTSVALAPQDDAVQHVNVEELSDAHEAPRSGVVLKRGLRVVLGQVVRDDQEARINMQGSGVHTAHPGTRHDSCTPPKFGPGEDLLPVAEMRRVKRLTHCRAHDAPQEVNHVRREVDALANERLSRVAEELRFHR